MKGLSFGFVIATLGLLTCVAGSAVAQETPRVLRPLKTAVEQANYGFVYPITDGLRPGFVYTMEKDAVTGKPFAKPLCENAYPGRAATADNLRLAAITTTVKVAFDGGAALPGAVQGVDLNAAVSASRNKKIAINFIGAKAYRFTADLPNAAGSTSQECKERIKPYFKANGVAIQPVYMVAKTFAIDGLAYSRTTETGAGLNLKAAADKIGNANVGVNAAWTSDASLTITPVQVTTAQPGQAADPLATNRFVVGVNVVLVPSADFPPIVGQQPLIFMKFSPVKDADGAQGLSQIRWR